MTSKPTPLVERLVENKEYSLDVGTISGEDDEFFLYDKDEKVTPLYPLSRGDKSGGKVAKWITGVQTKTNGKKVSTKGRDIFS